MLISRFKYWLLLLIFIVTACSFQQQSGLSFETIEAEDEMAPSGQHYGEQYPAIAVVATPGEITSLDNWVSSDALERLENLDYESQFVIAVFQGKKPTNQYGVEIEEVLREQDRVIIEARFRERQPDLEAADEITSPYHLVQVQKQGDWKRDIVFDLIVGETIVATLSHYIP